MTRTAILLAVIASTACTGTNRTAVTRTYCDTTGCYQCNDTNTCWLIDNAACESDLNCGGDQQCTTVGCCSICDSNSDCESDESCNNGFCVPVGFSNVQAKGTGGSGEDECKSTADCPAEKVCSQGRCTPKCAADEHCGPAEICAPCGKCQPDNVPVSCGEEPSFCDRTTKPCGSGKQCRSRRCHFTCTDSSTCPLGQICDASICIDDPAPTDPECTFDFECDGRCINGTCHASCRTSDDCETNLVCLQEICRVDYRPAP